MSVRDEVRELLENLPNERLDDVRTYLRELQAADATGNAWQERYSGADTDERIRTAVAEAEADPRPSLPHQEVAEWLRSWGTEHKLPPLGCG